LLFENYGQEIGGGDKYIVGLQPKVGGGAPVFPFSTVVAPMADSIRRPLGVPKPVTQNDLFTAK